LNAISQRIDEFSITGHQSADALGIAGINHPLELQHNFYGIGHGRCPLNLAQCIKDESHRLEFLV